MNPTFTNLARVIRRESQKVLDLEAALHELETQRSERITALNTRFTTEPAPEIILGTRFWCLRNSRYIEVVSKPMAPKPSSANWVATSRSNRQFTPLLSVDHSAEFQIQVDPAGKEQLVGRVNWRTDNCLEWCLRSPWYGGLVVFLPRIQLENWTNVVVTRLHHKRKPDRDSPPVVVAVSAVFSDTNMDEEPPVYGLTEAHLQKQYPIDFPGDLDEQIAKVKAQIPRFQRSACSTQPSSLSSTLSPSLRTPSSWSKKP